MYFKYHEELSEGIEGPPADALAVKMLTALNNDAYQKTTYLEWTFKKRRHYKWHKSENTCEVYWKDYKVALNLANPKQSEALKSKQEVTDYQREELIDHALKYFNNDSFWLVAPYKVFDPGTERRLVTNEDGSHSLLVTYTSGGSTPGDSYLWHVDDNGKPFSFQMWVDILPIDGLEASWQDWITTDSGAQLPTFHKFLFFGLEMDNIIGEMR